MSTITPNLPELKRLNMWVQEQDKLEPGARIWHQGDWVTQREETPMCQTAYCVAGMALARAGHTLGVIRVDWISKDQCFLDGKEVDEEEIPDLASEILGIEGLTSGLFSGGNSAQDIDKIIRRIFGLTGVDYDSVEPAPDLEIEIKAAEAVRPQLLPELEVAR